MKSTITNTSDTELTIDIIADQAEIDAVKKFTLERLGKDVKVPGFREGKAPVDMIEKQINRELLLNEFLDEAMSRLYSEAINQHNLRPVTRPEAEMKKFVPFTELEFSVKTQVIPEFKLPDYSKVKVAVEPVKVEEKDVDEVIENLRLRMSKKDDVTRAAKKTDQVWIDFDGKDAKGKEVNGASGKDYPLALGSNTFIPGFEDNLIGVKTGDEKSFDITFPKDYGVKALQSKKVTFDVKVNKVQEVTLPEVDDKLASEAGPFKNVAELREDIRKQLVSEREVEAQRKLQNDVMEKLVDMTDVNLPSQILESYEKDLMADLEQNLQYRGITYDVYLEQNSMTADEHKAKEVTPLAIKRAKAGLVLSEIAEAEKLMVTPEELDTRMELLKGQYQDPKMQEQLNNDAAKRDIAAQILSEKTMALIVERATTK